ncbi:hypothetical protein [Burkholderia sp. WSM2232]|uniref:hypothetical protein n=1 Tax=Burkholderia sp. WSM2232 TaxID=944436 RepID=UPI00047FB3C7|nr:hypothetical protein [Burkholderia sp. WSM2232]
MPEKPLYQRRFAPAIDEVSVLTLLRIAECVQSPATIRHEQKRKQKSKSQKAKHKTEKGLRISA